MCDEVQIFYFNELKQNLFKIIQIFEFVFYFLRQRRTVKWFDLINKGKNASETVSKGFRHRKFA